MRLKCFTKTQVTDQTGQALLFVVVAMTIALTVGVAVSSRTLSSLKRTSSTDTSTRVFSAAEGGAEWFLRQPISVLAELSDEDPDTGECPKGTVPDQQETCVLTFKPQGTDKIQSKAVITVKRFNVNHTQTGNDHYWFVLEPGGVKEIALKDYFTDTFYGDSVDVCWKSQESAQSAGLYYIINTPTFKEPIRKGILSPATVVGTFDVSGDKSAAPASQARRNLGFDSCYTLAIDKDSLGLRLKVLYVPARIGIFPSNVATFPTQGFAINSLGEVDKVAQGVGAVKEVTVYRSMPYAAGVFDYALYSDSAIN